MGLFVDDLKPFASGQSVTWLHKDDQGKVARVFAKVANVINDRVLLRVVNKATGAVYFKSVPLSSVQRITLV